MRSGAIFDPSFLWHVSGETTNRRTGPYASRSQSSSTSKPLSSSNARAAVAKNSRAFWLRRTFGKTTPSIKPLSSLLTQPLLWLSPACDDRSMQGGRRASSLVSTTTLEEKETPSFCSRRGGVVAAAFFSMQPCRPCARKHSRLAAAPRSSPTAHCRSSAAGPSSSVGSSIILQPTAGGPTPC